MFEYSRIRHHVGDRCVTLIGNFFFSSSIGKTVDVILSHTTNLRDFPIKILQKSGSQYGSEGNIRKNLTDTQCSSQFLRSHTYCCSTQMDIQRRQYLYSYVRGRFEVYTQRRNIYVVWPSDNSNRLMIITTNRTIGCLSLYLTIASINRS